MSVVPAEVEKWDAWHPAEAARLLAGVRAPWCVAAGWAIDLFLGGQRREHEDLEIAVPADRFAEFAEALAAFELFVPARCRRDEAIRLPYGDAIERTAPSHSWIDEVRAR